MRARCVAGGDGYCAGGAEGAFTAGLGVRLQEGPGVSGYLLWTYDVPKPGGGTETKIVQRNTGTDSSHPGQPHVEAGSPKANGQTDSIGRPRLDSNKTKVNVKKPDGQ